MNRHRIFATLLPTAVLTACNGAGAPATYSYKITEDGGPVVSNEHTYESIGDKTFTKTQKYRVMLQSQDRKFHYVIANIKTKVGNKVVQSEQGMMMPVVDGLYTLECVHFYDVKLSKSMDEVDNPTCEVEAVGVIVPDAKARIVKGGST